MIDKTDAVTTIVQAALNAASLNHAVIANNIANANTPGYVRGRVSFDRQFDAVRDALRDGAPVERNMLANLTPVIQRDPRAASANGADLDLDAASLAQNTLQYQALIKALNKHMALMKSAVSEGKR